MKQKSKTRRLTAENIDGAETGDAAKMARPSRRRVGPAGPSLRQAAEPAIPVLNIRILDFEFVSDFVFRVSDFREQHRQFVVHVEVTRAYRRRGMRAQQAAADEIKLGRSQGRRDGRSEDESKTLRCSVWAALIPRV